MHDWVHDWGWSAVVLWPRQTRSFRGRPSPYQGSLSFSIHKHRNKINDHRALPCKYRIKGKKEVEHLPEISSREVYKHSRDRRSICATLFLLRTYNTRWPYPTLSQRANQPHVARSCTAAAQAGEAWPDGPAPPGETFPFPGDASNASAEPALPAHGSLSQAFQRVAPHRWCRRFFQEIWRRVARNGQRNGHV